MPVGGCVPGRAPDDGSRARKVCPPAPFRAAPADPGRGPVVQPALCRCRVGAPGPDECPAAGQLPCGRGRYGAAGPPRSRAAIRAQSTTQTATSPHRTVWNAES